VLWGERPRSTEAVGRWDGSGVGALCGRAHSLVLCKCRLCDSVCLYAVCVCAAFLDELAVERNHAALVLPQERLDCQQFVSNELCVRDAGHKAAARDGGYAVLEAERAEVGGTDACMPVRGAPKAKEGCVKGVGWSEDDLLSEMSSVSSTPRKPRFCQQGEEPVKSSREGANELRTRSASKQAVGCDETMSPSSSLADPDADMSWVSSLSSQATTPVRFAGSSASSRALSPAPSHPHRFVPLMLSNPTMEGSGKGKHRPEDRRTGQARQEHSEQEMAGMGGLKRAGDTRGGLKVSLSMAALVAARERERYGDRTM
jgi:hypothetical protein